jgi:hypothetical protein
MSLESIAREMAYANDLTALEIEAEFSGLSDEEMAAILARLKKKYGRC